VQCTEYKLKVVTEHRMVKRLKPVTKEVTRTFRKLVYVNKSRVEDYIDYVEDWKTHTVKETVYDRVKVKKKGVRKVCRVKVSKEKRTVCRDLGCWQDREVSCCRKGCCTKICRVWVAKIVSEDVMVDVCQNVWVDEPYEWTEIVCKPRVVEKKVKRLHYKRVKKTRTVHWTACETKRFTKKVKETHYECVMVKKPYKRCTYEPVLVDRVVTRTVCKMVTKKVMCKLPIYGTCASTSSSCCD